VSRSLNANSQNGGRGKGIRKTDLKKKSQSDTAPSTKHTCGSKTKCACCPTLRSPKTRWEGVKVMNVLFKKSFHLRKKQRSTCGGNSEKVVKKLEVAGGWGGWGEGGGWMMVGAYCGKHPTDCPGGRLSGGWSCGGGWGGRRGWGGGGGRAGGAKAEGNSTDATPPRSPLKKRIRGQRTTRERYNSVPKDICIQGGLKKKSEKGKKSLCRRPA